MRKTRSNKNQRTCSGQGITEYGFVIAFVGILIVMAFWIKGHLFGSVSESYSSVNNSLGKLNQQASKNGGGLGL